MTGTLTHAPGTMTIIGLDIGTDVKLQGRNETWYIKVKSIKRISTLRLADIVVS